jgi:signal transduction histidine kinase
MRLRLSLQNRIFIVLGIITVLTLLIVWTVVRPKYEASVITERLTIVQQLQSYAIENLDRTIASWSNVTRFIVWQIPERPKEGEILLRSMMTLHPEIIQIKIHSLKLTDELISQNTSYPALHLQLKDSAWITSKLDTALYIQWINDTLQHQQFFITQMRFIVQDIPFVLTVTWDAKRLNTLFATLPIGEGYSVSIQSTSVVLIQNQSSFLPYTTRGTEERMSTLQSVHQNESNWRVLTSTFKTTQLWLIIAVPEKTILKPVEDLLLYTTSFILGLIFIMLVLGWMLAHQISRPIARLVKDVQKLSNLDFTQSIQIPAMKDLSGMGETIELMRQVLERYQRLNVEKIILEEWKNKLFMTHSDDMIGFTDGAGIFVFRNDTLEEFCSSLLPTRPLNSKSDVLTHPSIVKIKETIHDEASDTLDVHLVQSELKVQTDSDIPSYYRVNDLTLIRNGDNLGSLLIFHDLTNERLIDKTKTEMINLVVHELRNPVGSIMGFSEILLSDTNVSEEERGHFIQLILTSSKNLSNLINRFLDVSRLESHRVEYPKSLTDIVSIVKAVIDIQMPQLLNKSLTVELEIKGSIPEIVVSPDLFREAVSNLLSNAIKYGAPDRIINIVLTLDNQNIIFSIIDHGYGIPSDKQEKLFTKFYRVYNPKAKQEVGTGLGLAYVKEIATYHNGSIALESDSTIGCKFTITIPVKESESSIENSTGG